MNPDSALLSAPAQGSQRIAWVDYAKGICIFMVLMLHAAHEIGHVLGDRGWIATVVEYCRPFRMPDFFLISGLFLANVIDRPARLYYDRKFVHYMYFYVLWAGGYFLLFGIKTALDQNNGDWSSVPPAYLLTFIQPGGPLWFVHSLAIYFVIVRLTRAIPWWLILGATAFLQTCNIETGWQVIDEFCRRFVFFYSGYLFARHIFRISDWALTHRGLTLAYIAVWAVANGYVVFSGWSTLPVVGLVLGYAGAGAIILAATLLSTIRWTDSLRYIGANSIVLYLADYLIQRVALKLGFASVPLDPGSLALLLTFVSVIGTLSLYWCGRLVGITFPFERPEWAKLRTTTAVSSGSAASR